MHRDGAVTVIKTPARKQAFQGLLKYLWGEPDIIAFCQLDSGPDQERTGGAIMNPHTGTFHDRLAIYAASVRADRTDSDQ